MKKNYLRYYSNNREEMRNFLPSAYSTVLEIGCGRGNFSNTLRQIPCEIWGVEPNASMAQEAKQKLDHILIGTFDDVEASIPNNYFDLVICNDVIEHMPDHDGFLEKIKNKIKPTGQLVGSIPNILYITSFHNVVIKKDWPYKDAGIFDRTHFRFFTAKSLKNCLASHNYVLVKFSGINSVFTGGNFVREYESPFKDFLYHVAALLFIIGTLGYYYDSQYPQFGFAVKKAG